MSRLLRRRRRQEAQDAPPVGQLLDDVTRVETNLKRAASEMFGVLEQVKVALGTEIQQQEQRKDGGSGG